MHLNPFLNFQWVFHGWSIKKPVEGRRKLQAQLKLEVVKTNSQELN